MRLAAARGLGHGVTAWLRRDNVTQLTSNHLETIRPDRLVDAGGTLVNLAVGLCILPAVRRVRSANLGYFLWLLSALNVLHAAVYFLFSGIGVRGDWARVIAGLPDQSLLRARMAIMGAGLYVVFVRLIAVAASRFAPTRADYNTVGRVAYVAGRAFMTLAGAFDPLGIKLLFRSTMPAYLGGSSGLLRVDAFSPSSESDETLTVQRNPALWGSAGLAAIAFIAVLGRGITYAH